MSGGGSRIHVHRGVAITRSNLEKVRDPDFFMWATGIEDTFITDPHARTGRTLDEYELTQHYDRWQDDVDLIAGLGVSYARYGIPWHRIEAARGRFDFSWTDRVFDRLIRHGVHPIVDLVHYGTPPWLQRGFADPDYPERVRDYAGAVAERYRGTIRWYTPLNEPRITAYYCGKLGWWPPYGKSWSKFLEVLVSVAKGIALTQEALRAVDPEIVVAHVDATDLYTAEGDAWEAAELRRNLVFLALDMVMGRVQGDHQLLPWLRTHGVQDRDLESLAVHPAIPDIIGLNLYPMFTNKLVRKIGGRLRVTMPYGSATIIGDIAEMYWRRYGIPLFISETASVGRRRGAWMADSFDAVRKVRYGGIPLVGYTWWPLFALVGWAYRERDLPFGRYLLQLGLYDLEIEDRGGLARVSTPLVDDYRKAVESGCDRIGQLRITA